MKKKELWFFVYVLITIPLFVSCATLYEDPPQVTRGYDTPVSYKDGRHPGVDFKLNAGTPIISCADGVVKWIIDESDKPYSYGLFVIIEHGEYANKNL